MHDICRGFTLRSFQCHARLADITLQLRHRSFVGEIGEEALLVFRQFQVELGSHEVLAIGFQLDGRDEVFLGELLGAHQLLFCARSRAF